MPTLSSNIVKREIASVHDVEEALARQSLYGGDLVTNLLELARVSEDRLTRAVAESVGLEPAPAGELPRAPERVRRLVPGDVAHRYALYPLTEAEGRLVVAVSEPLPSDVASDLEFSLGLSLEQRAATLVRVQQAVCRDYGLDLDRRVARVLARLSGTPDPHPTVPPPKAAAATSETPFAPSVQANETPFAPPVQANETPFAPPVQASETPSAPPVEATSIPDVAPGAEEPPGSPSSHTIPPEPRPSTHSSLPLMSKLDVASLAGAEARANRRRRRLGPYTPAMAEADLRDSETRDEVMGAFFDFASQYFEYSALFAVHGDLAEGRDAHGSGAPRARVLAIGVPLDLPSTLASVVQSEPYRLARLSGTGLDGALAKDLERRPGKTVLLLPIRVRERAVLVLYGDHGANDVELSSVGDILSFAPLVAGALERVILLRKGVSQRGRIPGTQALRERRPALPNAHDRATALATALVEPPLAPVARISAAPVISIGPKGHLTPTQGAVIPKLPAPPAELAESASPPPFAVTPLPTAYSLRPTTPTPVPSSLAPGAPPQQRPREPQPAGTLESQPGARPESELGAGATAHGTNGASTEPHSPPEPSAHSEREPAGPVTKLGVGPSRPPPKPLRLSSAPVWTPSPEVNAVKATTAHAVDSARRLQLVSDGESPPELVVEEAAADPALEELLVESEPIPFIPRSRSVAHSARPLPAPMHSEELRLPTVIVDLANDTEDLVERVVRGDAQAADRLVEIGAAAVPALVGAFPGPILSELKRGAGEGPARASECGPILKILARIGPKAAGVLGVRTNDSRPDVRAWATRLLGEMPCTDAARAVARRFVDEDPEVRRAALAAGRMLQGHSVAGAVLSSTLSEMLLDSSRKAAQTHMIIEAVADLREARVLPALAAVLAAGSAEVQRSAHWALVVLARHDYGDNAAAWQEWWRLNANRHRIEWLIDALMHESAEIRRAAGDELKSVTKEYFGYYDDLPARERERAQRRYREWWETKGKARFGVRHP